MTVHTIVPALALSGQGRRLCALEHLGERTLLAHLLETLHQVGLDQPLLLVPAQKADQVSDIDLPPHRVIPVPGTDPDRREALRCALAELDIAGPGQTVMIHDAERALVPADTIQAVLEADDPSSVDGVVPVIDMTDSVKAVRSEGLVNIDRSTLATVQCPRLLRCSVLEDVLSQSAPVQAGRGAGHGMFDEVQAGLARGARLRTVPGTHRGFAIADRLSLWQAQIALGIARDTTHRHGLSRR